MLHMSTYDISAEGYAAPETAPALSTPEQIETSTLTEARIIQEISDARAVLDGRVHLAGFKVDQYGLYGKHLPTTPLPEGMAEDRQRVALADLETYKKAADSPEMRQTVGGTLKIDFKGYTWDRKGDGSQPVYTEAAMLNPNFALMLSFDLDENGYATTSRARLMMSRDPQALLRGVDLATDNE